MCMIWRGAVVSYIMPPQVAGTGARLIGLGVIAGLVTSFG